MGFVALFGLGVTRAAGNTKVLNMMSNVGALALFIPSGDVVWPAAGPWRSDSSWAAISAP